MHEKTTPTGTNDAYVPLMLEDEESTVDAKRQQPPSRRSRWIIGAAVFTLTLVVAIIIIISSTTILSRTATNHPARPLDTAPLSNPGYILLGECGEDYIQAQRLGCVYDVMLGHWVSPACFDAELHHKYLTKHAWAWFDDASLSSPLPADIVARGDRPGAWVSLQFHFHHCSYLWELQVKSLTQGTPLAEYLWSYEHAEHCAAILAEYEYPGRNVTYVETLTTRCILPQLTQGLL